MDLTKYKIRLDANTIGEAYTKDTINIINDVFHESPSYTKIMLNGIDDDCQLKTTDDSDKFEIFLRPEKNVDKGDFVTLKEKNYLVTKSIKNHVYPKAEITLCNNTLTWKDSLGNIFNYPCVIEGNVIDISDSSQTNNERFVILSKAEITVLVPYNNDTKTIKANDKFIFSGNAFEVVSIDKLTEVFEEKGVIKFVVQAVSSPVSTEPSEDDNVYDEDNNSGWGGW